MALVDTTKVIDNSIFLKAKLDKNMVGSNYYIENLQYKRDKDWEFRYNVVGIEEENEKQCDYTNELPNYTPIDVAIRTVKSDKGKDLGLDWANIAFKNLNHPVFLGKRFRFSTEFYDMLNMHIIFLVISSVLTALGPVFKMLLSRINTAVDIDGYDQMEAIDISSED